MEAQVENNVKKQTKKKKHMYRLNSITEKLRKWRKYWKERTYYEQERMILSCYELVPLA